MVRYLVPLIVFVLLAGLLYAGLHQDPTRVTSPLLNKPAPQFTLPQLHKAEETFSPEKMKGQVWLFNVWASWCVSCRQEHPVLVNLSRMKEVPLLGLNYKDERKDGLRWLQQFGDPYDFSAFDLDGRVGIDFGVYGVPETFIIDKQGVIRHKVIGPVTPRSLQECVLPVVRALKQDQEISKALEKACA